MNMASSEKSSTDERTSLDQAILKILEVLEKHKGMNVSQIAKATQLNWKTADKVLTLLIELTKKLQGKEIELYQGGQSRMYVLTDRFALDRLPAPLRDAFVRSQYPEPTVEQKMLTELLLAGATCSTMAVSVEEDTIIDALLEKKRLKRSTAKKVYLTDIGMRIARGALRTYSELADKKTEYVLVNL